MLHKKIKDATQTLHTELEELMYVKEIMAGNLTYRQYARMLEINYLITAEYEQQLIKSLDCNIALRLDIHKRIKLEALLKDLSEVKIAPGVLKEKAHIKLDPEYALGCLYVLESATLGGNVVVTKLKDNKHLSPYQLHFNYYRVYGEQLISFWKQFCEIINEQPERNYPKIIEGAKDMYSSIIDLNLSL